MFSPGPFDQKSLSAGQLGIALADEITIGGRTVDPQAPPEGLRVYPDLGLVTGECLQAQRLHAWQAPNHHSYHPRAVKTPRGDYLVMFSAGRAHGGGTTENVNDMVAYRSFDRGKTWDGPSSPWHVPYSHNSGSLLVPRGADRIHFFCEEPHPDWYQPPTNGGMTMRYSDDDGYTWSAPELIAPINDPGYRGLGHMQMCETDAGTWLLGTYTVRLKPGTGHHTDRRQDRQYVLRSEDQGRTWTLLPGKRPRGWFIGAWDVMLEGQVINLRDRQVLLVARAPGGHPFELRSNDDGRTWTAPKPMPVVHPDAPPMVFWLASGKTMIFLHHNRYSPDKPRHDHTQRSELWFSLSRDDGHTWSEPRFLLAGAAVTSASPSVSYDDLLVDGQDLHLFVDFQFRQVLHVQFSEADLEQMLTRAQLVDRIGTP